MGNAMRFFKRDEFGGWYESMSADLLLKLDDFRSRWGAPVVVSSAPGGVGRNDGPEGTSQHNVDQWGEVRAVDVFPMVRGEGGRLVYMNSAEDRARAVRIAQEVGFTGIGVYTDTGPGNMVHLDVRIDRNAIDPALWARVSGQYVGIDRGLA
ncbi:MAG: hypothetical protein CMQ38_05805 [Gammaproteobacteria bacterium]|nr:hypothetical protein [Gammaproteobacteria bacterium]